MIFEIVNPSDAYTMESDDKAVACAASLLLCSKFGLRLIAPVGTVNEHFSMPPFIFGGWREWFLEQFRVDIEQFIEANLARIADALDSVLIGDAKDRTDFYRALELIDDPAKKQKWREEYLDRRRSSMNNIGGSAMRWAAGIRAKLATPPTADNAEAGQ